MTKPGTIHFLIFLFFLFTKIELAGQAVPVNDSLYYHNLSFMVKGGINYAPLLRFPSSFSVSTGDEAVLHRMCNINPGIGYSFGIGASYQINRKWSIQTGIDLLENRLHLNYQQGLYHNIQGLYDLEEGTFEQDQRYLKVPLLINYSLGKKIKWQVGAGLYWMSAKNIRGNWTHYNSQNSNIENCKNLEMPADFGQREEITLLQMNNWGGILQAQLNIPLNWKVEILLGSQYFQEFKALPSPSISRSQVIFETGFRFKFKYD